MIHYAVVIAAVAGISWAMPAGAEGDRDRDRDVIRDRDHRDSDKPDIIKKGDHDRDVDHDRQPVVIDR
jgi:hypothetical protein